MSMQANEWKFGDYIEFGVYLLLQFFVCLCVCVCIAVCSAIYVCFVFSMRTEKCCVWPKPSKVKPKRNENGRCSTHDTLSEMNGITFWLRNLFDIIDVQRSESMANHFEESWSIVFKVNGVDDDAHWFNHSCWKGTHWRSLIHFINNNNENEGES